MRLCVCLCEFTSYLINSIALSFGLVYICIMKSITPTPGSEHDIIANLIRGVDRVLREGERKRWHDTGRDVDIQVEEVRKEEMA